MAIAFGPDSRTMAMAPTPGGVEIAQMVSLFERVVYGFIVFKITNTKIASKTPLSLYRNNIISE